MALHEAPPRRSNHREAIAMDVVPRQVVSTSAHSPQSPQGAALLSFPRQNHPSPYSIARLDAVSLSTMSYRRSPAGSSVSLCAPVTADTTPSPISSTHRFDMKRMLSKPASTARTSSPESLTARPKTAPSPTSSPERPRFNGKLHRPSSHSYSSSDLSSPTGSAPSPAVPSSYDHPAGQLTPLPISRTRRGLSFPESDGPQAEERKQSPSEQSSSSSHHHRKPPIATSSSDQLNEMGGTPPVETPVQQPFPIVHGDEITRHGFLSSIPPSLHSTTGPTREYPHVAATQEDPSASYLLPSQSPTTHLPPLNSNGTSHSSHSVRPPRKKASTSLSPSSTPANSAQFMTSKSLLAAEHQRAQRDREAFERARVSGTKTHTPQTSRSEPATPHIDPYAAVDYVPAGPREYTAAMASVAMAGASSNRSPARHATAPAAATPHDQRPSPHRFRAVTTRGAPVETISSIPPSVSLKASPSSPENSGTTTPYASGHSPSSQNLPASTKSAGPNEWQAPPEWAYERHLQLPSTSTQTAIELNPSTTTVATQDSADSATVSVEEDGLALRTLTRKVSRKLLKRPRRLDLDPGAAGATPVADLGRSPNAGPAENASAADSKPGTAWIDGPLSFTGRQQTYESPMPSAQIVPHQKAPTATHTDTDEGTHRSSGGNRLYRLMKKLSSPSLRDPRSSYGTSSPKRVPSDLTEVPPVPPLPASASLSASLNSPSVRTRENGGPPIRRTSSSTDLGVLLASSNQALLLRGDTGSGVGLPTTVDSNTGYLSRVFRRRGSISSRSQVSQHSRHETETTTTVSSRRSTAWSRRSTSSSQIGGEDYPDPSPVPPVPERSWQRDGAVTAGACNPPAVTTGAITSLSLPLSPQHLQVTDPSPPMMDSARLPNLDFEADPSSALDLYDLTFHVTSTNGNSATCDGAASTPTGVSAWRENPLRYQSHPTNTLRASPSSSINVSAPLQPVALPTPLPPKLTTSIRKRLDSFKALKEKEKDKDQVVKQAARSRDSRNDTVGISSHPVYSSTHRSPSRKTRERRLSLDSGGGATVGQHTVSVANFAELSLDSTPKKTALEKDRMWDELLRRSDRAPGGTLHASIRGGGLELASDDLDGNIL